MKNLFINYWKHLDEMDKKYKWLIPSKYLIYGIIIGTICLTYLCIHWNINPINIFLNN